jgi:hypothetical protein
MIKLDTEHDTPELYQEGVLDNALKAAGDIDANKIKEVWKNADKGIYDKAKILDDEGLKKLNKKGAEVNKKLSKNVVNNSSIIARAKNSVLQFPIYVTQGIRINEAQIISKMFERVYTTLVQTVLSQNLIIDANEANNLVFLKQFHTNLTESAEVLINKYYEAIDNIDQMMSESIFHKVQITDKVFAEFRVVPTTNETLIMENARLANEPLQGFFYLREKSEKEEWEEDTYSKRFNKLTPEEKEKLKNEDRKTLEKGNKREIEQEGGKPEKVLTEEEIADLAKEHNLMLDGKHPDVEAMQKIIRTGKERIDFIYANTNRRVQVRKNKKGEWEYYVAAVEGKTVTRDSHKEVDVKFRDAVEAPRLLKDVDIKKINGMLPYSIEATFRLKTDQGLDRDVRYIIGIKSIMHLISIKDLTEDLREIITGKIKTLQKVRYKTGEITFKDYFFNIKGLKADAAKHINYDKRWLNTLKRLGEYETMNGTLLKSGIKAITGGHIPIPNGTLVLSQPEVTKLTNETGIDLSIVSNAKRLAKSLFLIGVVIIDSTAGTMRVLFTDSDVSWDVQSLASIDAELSKTDNSQLMKELNRMVNK